MIGCIILRPTAAARPAAPNPKDMPFDAKRMFWGGFRQVIAL